MLELKLALPNTNHDPKRGGIITRMGVEVNLDRDRSVPKCHYKWRREARGTVSPRAADRHLTFSTNEPLRTLISRESKSRWYSDIRSFFTINARPDSSTDLMNTSCTSRSRPAVYFTT